MAEFPYPFFPVQFDAKGNLFQQSDVDKLLAGLSTDPRPTDLFILSHGWNNNIDEAEDLYSRLAAELATQIQAPPELKDRVFAICGILWPSKKFEDAELIPSGAASLNDAVSDSHIRQRIDDLKKVAQGEGWPSAKPDAAIEAKLSEVIANLDDWEDDPAVRQKIVENIREILPAHSADTEDASQLFFKLKPEVLIENLERSLNPPPISPDSSAASLDPFADPSGDGTGGAASFRDLAGGLKGALLHLLNYTTYYIMKARAGDVGVKGVAPLIQTIRTARPELRLHLIGHSFGCRVVTAAVNALPSGQAFRPNTMTLLQGAFSHNGFAANFDGKNNDGAFRQVVEQKKVRGPILISHTRRDKAVGIAYPIASRIAGQKASALGDANDVFGGLGSNGAQTRDTTPEAVVGTLLNVGGAYPFATGETSGKLYNLRADAFISGHSDIASAPVAYAIAKGLATPDAT